MMKNSTTTNDSSKNPRWLYSLVTLWYWLTEPSSLVTEPARRYQARLLMEMQITLILLGLLSLPLSLLGEIPEGTQQPVKFMFFWITVVGVLLLAIGYVLSRMAQNDLAAFFSVATLLTVTFGAVIINPRDLTTTSYLILGGLMGSLFLSVRATARVFLVTCIGLLLLPKFMADFSTTNILNSIYFIVTVGGFIIMEAILRQRYLKQIGQQTQQLIKSEARLRELSIRDPLTGLFNRRYLEEVLALEIARATRKQFPIGIIMADIDHFKRLNDTYGHAAGDLVLSEVGKWFHTHIRASDIACRYGGEEFILILPEASLTATKIRAEQMRERFKSIQVKFGGRTLDPITMSMGVAIFPDHGSTLNGILHAVDAALYRAKHEGRDRTAAAG